MGIDAQEDDVAPLPVSPTPDLGWSKFVGNELKVYNVPGNHLTMMTEPHVQALAERLRFCLEQADGGDTSSVKRQPHERKG